MKILVVSQYFWPENFIINDMCQGLVERGHDVTVLTGVPNYPTGNFFSGYSMFSKDEEYQGIKVKRVPILPRGQNSNLKLFLNYLSYGLIGSIWAPFKCKEKFDLIFVMQLSPVSIALPAIFLKRIRKTPIVMWVQDLWPESLTATGAIKSSKLVTCINLFVRWIYRNCDLVLAQSQAFIEKIKATEPRVQDCQYLPNWAPSFFRPLPPQAQTSLPKGFLIMFAGNIGVAQNLSLLIEASRDLKDLKNLKFVLVGDGRDLPRLKNEIENSPLKEMFHFSGRRPTEEMPHFFSQAQALLVTLRPDPIFSLTVPSKVQTYMACAKPIIASLDGEGARVVNEAKAGYTSPAGDAKALAEKIRAFYHDSHEKRQEMAQNSLSYFKRHFEREKVLNDLECFIDVLSLKKEN